MPTNAPKPVESETENKSNIFTNGNYDVLSAINYMTNSQYNTGDNSQTDNKDFYNKAEYERFDRDEYYWPNIHKMSGECANSLSQALVVGGVKMNVNMLYI